jgi:hypothetical protein
VKGNECLSKQNKKKRKIKMKNSLTKQAKKLQEIIEADGLVADSSGIYNCAVEVNDDNGDMMAKPLRIIFKDGSVRVEGKDAEGWHKIYNNRYSSSRALAGVKKILMIRMK